MTQEEKDLLFKDLCARLPYGVKVKYLYWDENKDCEYPIAMVLDAINSDGYIKFHGDIAEGEGSGMLTQNLPYLRPMTSMTEEEKIELKSITKGAIQTIGLEDIVVTTDKGFDYLNAHHFDYRGLIEKGLAVEAPENMYKEN
jgi:hypothetical protein